MTHPEHNFTKFYEPKGEDVYVEVGAFSGATALLLPKTVRKILVEAEPHNADNLQKMIDSGELQNAQVIRTAVASSKGKMSYRVMGTALNCSRLIESPTHQLALVQNAERSKFSREEIMAHGEPGDWTPEGEPVEWCGYTIEVETDTLESILDGIGRYEADMFFGIDHIDLLASDCESCEFDMVKYAGKWLDPKKVRNWAIADYHIATRAQEIPEALEKAGYRIETDLGGNGYHGEPATGRGQLVVYGLSP